MSTKPRSDGPAALDLIEEATHLVRCVPLSCSAAYALGTVPFALGLTFFAAEMSRGAHAAEHLPGSALLLVGLFAWMKAWQAHAAEQALAFLEQRPALQLGASAWLMLAVRQFSAHAFGLVLLPLAWVAALPGGWVYAYYQNVTVLGAGAGPRTHRLALEQARLWPGQNHLALGALSLLGLVVFGNAAVSLYVVPMLIRTITGTERVFAQTGWNPLNTTLLAAACALAFLLTDPVIKAFYVLRCFYGRSRRTGVDLLVQVRAAAPRAVGLAIAVILAAGMGATRVGAQDDEVSSPAGAVEGVPVEPPVPAVAPVRLPPAVERVDAVSTSDMDAAIERVLRDPEYIWREPAKTGKSGFARDTARWIRQKMEALQDWLRRVFGGEKGSDGVGVSPSGSFFSPATIMWVFAVAALVLVALVAVTVMRRTHTPVGAAGAVQATPVPQLERDDLTADQLPEDEWMRLARELIARGDVRLGLRALFLGSLAGLAGRGLLVLARHKSNRDYERELLRRGTPVAAASTAYLENRRAFEGVWYGGHLPDAELLARFEDNVRLLVRRDPS